MHVPRKTRGEPHEKTNHHTCRRGRDRPCRLRYDDTGQQQLTGGLVGATAGLVAASALSAGAGWTLVTALAGATVGTLVARNERTGQCAYARADGRYDTRPCR